MANKDRTAAKAVALSLELESEPYRFGFFNALRRLETAYPDKPRLGRGRRPSDDPVRLAQEPSLAFAPSMISSYTQSKDGKPDRISELFFGVFGPNGPLPLHLTEYARDRLRNNSDATFSRFADIFHHRLLCLFYRAWANGEPTVSFDRPETDDFATYLGALMGIALPAMRDADVLEDRAKLHHVGLYSNHVRNADGLRATLECFFDMPVEIEEFTGEWMALPDNCRLRLGESPETGTLGINATLGARVWGCQQKIRITMGPVGLSDLWRLLPGSDSLDRLVAVVRNYVFDELNWDLRLILKKEQVPELRLGKSGHLGWTTWFTPRPWDHDADDVVLHPLTGSAEAGHA